MNEKTKKEVCCETDDALECAEKYLENCRKHLKDVMKDAEKAAKELEKDTATEKTRLQGTKEPEVPNLKPYTESINARNRIEVGKAIEKAKAENKDWKVKRCNEELAAQGYRYTVTLTSLTEDLEITTMEAEPEEAEAEETDIQIKDGVIEQPGREERHQDDLLPAAMEILKSKLDIKVDDGKVTVALKGELEDEDATHLEFETEDEEGNILSGIFVMEEPEEAEPEEDDKEEAESELEVPEDDAEEMVEIDFSGEPEEVEEDFNKPTEFDAIKQDLMYKTADEVIDNILKLLPDSRVIDNDIYFYDGNPNNMWGLYVGGGKLGIQGLSGKVGAYREFLGNGEWGPITHTNLDNKQLSELLHYLENKLIEIEKTYKEHNALPGEFLEESLNESWITVPEDNKEELYDAYVIIDSNGLMAPKVVDIKEMKIDQRSLDDQILLYRDKPIIYGEKWIDGELHKVSEIRVIEKKRKYEDLDEASSAEKKAFKNGGDDYSNYVDGKAIARIKDPDERDRAIANKRLSLKNKLGDRAPINKEYERKVNQADAAFQKKQQKMAAAGAGEEKVLNENTKIDLDDLSMFNPWGGAKDTWELILAQDKLKELDKALEDMYPDGLTASDLNDILWFEKDWVFDSLGINPFIDKENAIDVEAEVTTVEEPTEEPASEEEGE